jgi:hypothetical protein
MAGGGKISVKQGGKRGDLVLSSLIIGSSVVTSDIQSCDTILKSMYCKYNRIYRFTSVL